MSDAGRVSTSIIQERLTMNPGDTSFPNTGRHARCRDATSSGLTVANTKSPSKQPVDLCTGLCSSSRIFFKHTHVHTCMHTHTHTLYATPFTVAMQQTAQPLFQIFSETLLTEQFCYYPPFQLEHFPDFLCSSINLRTLYLEK